MNQEPQTHDQERRGHWVHDFVRWRRCNLNRRVCVQLRAGRDESHAAMLFMPQRLITSATDSLGIPVYMQIGSQGW